MTSRTGEISGLRFGLVGDDYILDKSVCALATTPCRKRTAPVLDTVYDPRLGSVFSGVCCSTCGKNPELCSGHIGHIELAAPVLTALSCPYSIKLFSCFCIRCAKLRILPDRRQVPSSTDAPLRSRILHAHKLVAPGPCPSCGQVQPIQWTLVERVVLRPVWSTTDVARVITPAHLYRLLYLISDEDMLFVGFHPGETSIHTVLRRFHIVPPILIRPPRSTRSEDDLTTRLRMILKSNGAFDTSRVLDLSMVLGENGAFQELAVPPTDWKPRHVRSKVALFPFHLEEYFDLARHAMSFQDGRFYVKNDLDYGRELQSIRSRFAATRKKRGRLRASIMGKRGDFTARAVASPNTHQDIDEVGVPEYVCMNVTVTERVCTYNYNQLCAAVMNGPHRYPGANFIERNANLYMLPYFNRGGLQLGDVVHRHLVRGDIVIMNRQPSLHRYSMLAYRVRPHRGSTFQLHLAVTTAHNLDFDGDEVNLFLPGSLAARVEAHELMSLHANLFRRGAILFGFVQHACLGAFLMSESTPHLHVSDVQQLLYSAGFLPGFIAHSLSACGGPRVPARLLLSVLLPTYDQRAPLDKNTLNACVSLHLKAYPGDGVRYIGCLTRLFEEYLLRHGSTLSIRDCSATLPGPARDLCERTYRVCTQLPEHQCIGVLEKLRDYVGLRIYRDLGVRGSNLLRIVSSGAKGNVTHITQNAGMIGQQLDRQCARHAAVRSHLCLPLEERGFVRSSFVSGLSPVEFFQHLSSARIGLVATAVSTSETGYCYRRISKALEDVRVHNDLTMRDAGNRIILTHGLFDTSRWVYTNRSRLVYMASIPDTLCTEEHGGLVRLRTELCRLRHDTYEMSLPVDLVRVARQLREGHAAPTPCPTLFAIVRKACEHLLAVHTIPRGTILRHLYMDLLSTANLGNARPAAVERELDRCHERFVRYLRTPYEPFGLIASQSFSEPLTQMQLNLFHHSGERTGMVDGVVRIKEILNLFKTPSVPTMLVVVRLGCEGVARPNDLVQLLLMDTVDFWSDADLPPAIPGARARDIYIRLKKSMLLRHECCPRHVAEAICGAFAEQLSIVWYTEDLAHAQYGVCVRLSDPAEDALAVMARLERSPLLLKRILGILDFYEDHALTVSMASDCGLYFHPVPRKAFRLSGSNFVPVCMVPWVDIVHTTTNDLRSVYRELGIDAVIRCIKHELAGVMCTNSASVQDQHILLMAAIMCSSGQPCALTYTGMTTADASTLKLATFERSLDSFIHAGSEGHVDDLNGISESVMIGKCVRTGTGMVHVVVPTTPPTTGSSPDIHWGTGSTPVVTSADLDMLLADVPGMASEIQAELLPSAKRKRPVSEGATRKKPCATPTPV